MEEIKRQVGLAPLKIPRLNNTIVTKKGSVPRITGNRKGFAGLVDDREVFPGSAPRLECPLSLLEAEDSSGSVSRGKKDPLVEVEAEKSSVVSILLERRSAVSVLLAKRSVASIPHVGPSKASEDKDRPARAARQREHPVELIEKLSLVKRIALEMSRRIEGELDEDPDPPKIVKIIRKRGNQAPMVLERNALRVPRAMLEGLKINL